MKHYLALQNPVVPPTVPWEALEFLIKDSEKNIYGPTEIRTRNCYCWRKFCPHLIAETIHSHIQIVGTKTEKRKEKRPYSIITSSNIFQNMWPKKTFISTINFFVVFEITSCKNGFFLKSTYLLDDYIVGPIVIIINFSLIISKNESSFDVTQVEKISSWRGSNIEALLENEKDYMLDKKISKIFKIF